MKLNQVPNFRSEDYPGQQEWISKLFISLNPFIQAVNQVFSQNVDFGTNIKAVTQTYTINAFQAFSIQWPFTDLPPVDLKITQALKGSRNTATILLAAWSYDSAQRLITISSMVEVATTGVSALSGRYQFTVRANA
jgi:hypothetical protein